MATKVRPLHDRLIVQLIEEGEQQVGGIIIPDTAKEKPQQGKVIAAGKGKVREDGSVQPLDVKAGDTVLFGKYSGSEIKLDGEELAKTDLHVMKDVAKSGFFASTWDSIVLMFEDEHQISIIRPYLIKSKIDLQLHLNL